MAGILNLPSQQQDRDYKDKQPEQEGTRARCKSAVTPASAIA